MSDEQAAAPATPTPAAAPSPPPPPAPDPAEVAFREEVARALGTAADTAAGVPAWRVEAGGLLGAARRLRDAGFDYLLFMTAVDHPADGRLELVYLFSRFSGSRHGALLADVPREAAEVDSLSGVWAAADWHERETYDMFGIRFRNHPFLRRILLDEDWPGHPLRKDYVDTLHDVVKRPY